MTKSEKLLEELEEREYQMSLSPEDKARLKDLREWGYDSDEDFVESYMGVCLDDEWD